MEIHEEDGALNKVSFFFVRGIICYLSADKRRPSSPGFVNEIFEEERWRLELVDSPEEWQSHQCPSFKRFFDPRNK